MMNTEKFFFQYHLINGIMSLTSQQCVISYISMPANHMYHLGIASEDLLAAHQEEMMNGLGIGVVIQYAWGQGQAQGVEG